MTKRTEIIEVDLLDMSVDELSYIIGFCAAMIETRDPGLKVMVSFVDKEPPTESTEHSDV